MKRKWCYSCAEWKPETDFFLTHKNGTTRRGPCKPCYRAIYNADYRRMLAERKRG